MFRTRQDLDRPGRATQQLENDGLQTSADHYRSVLLLSLCPQNNQRKRQSAQHASENIHSTIFDLGRSSAFDDLCI